MSASAYCPLVGVTLDVERPGFRFCRGVQWYPEFLIDASDRLIFEGFVAAALETR